ncbi:MAG: FtsX-like permease family protein [Pseudomonadota bacterium]
MTITAYRANIHYLSRHPWQFALAMVGVIIGVAVMVAVDLANTSARKAFLLSMDQVVGSATHQIVGGPRGVPETVYSNLRTLHAVESVAPIIDGSVDVGERVLGLLGVDLFAEQSLRAFTGDVTPSESASSPNLFSAFLIEPGVVTLSATTADELGLKVGENFNVQVNGVVHPARLVAVSTAAPDNLFIADIATAQEWLNQQGWLSRIDVRLTDDTVQAGQLQQWLPDGVRLLTAPGRTQATAAMSDAFMTNLTAMSLLALLVGLFLIFNSMSFSVLQRRSLIATLRAIGITRRHVFVMIVAEAAVLSLIAAGLGVLLGIWLGEHLLELVSRSINALYYRVSVTSVSVSSVTIAKGLVAGVLTSIVAALAPAYDASRFAPRQVMLRSDIEQRAGRVVPWVALIGVIGVVAATLLLLVTRHLAVSLTAVFLLILGIACCVPAAIQALCHLLEPLARTMGGTPARLAVSTISASLSRTAVAIVALAIAVSATIGVSIMVDSFRTSVQSWLEQTLRADIYAGAQRGAIQPALIDDIRAIPGIVAVSTNRRIVLEQTTGRTQLTAIHMAPESYAGTTLLDGNADSVWPRWEKEDAVLVSEPYAYQQNVAAGDVITLPTDRGPQSFTVLARYQSFDINASTVMISRDNYDRYFDDKQINTLGLYLHGNTDVERIIDTITAISTDRQVLRVDANARIRDASLEIFDQTFVITNVLYWLALGVAFIGILGAMLALQLERARELALLRALGMTPAQVSTLITTQTGVMGLLSGLAALPLGIVMAWVLIRVINRRAFGWEIEMTFSPAILITSLLFAISVALLAGLYPAWRAGKSHPALAMREE